MKHSLKIDAAWGVFDQALQSLTSLLTGVFLISFASKDQYGLFGIGYAAILLIFGIANAMVMLQMTVIAPSKAENERRLYCASMFLVLLAFSLAVAFVFILIIVLFSSLMSSDYQLLWLATGISLPGFLIIEFTRSYLYFTVQPKLVFLMDALSFTLLAIFLLFTYLYDLDNLHILTLIFIGASALIASLFANLRYIRLPLKASSGIVVDSFKEAWNHGVWALGGVVVSNIQNQGYIYLLALFRGTASVAEANAARLFLAPIGVMSMGFARVFIPRIAILRAEGNHRRAIDISLKILLALLLSITTYTGCLYFGLDFITSTSFFSEYHHLESLVWLWAIFFVGQSIRSTPTHLLQVYQKFKPLTIIVSITSIFVFILSIYAIKIGGIQGAILAMTFGEIFLAILLWKYFRSNAGIYQD